MNYNARRKLIIGGVVAVSLLLTAPSVRAQDQETSALSSLEDWQREELQSLVEVVGAALRGQLVEEVEKPFVFNPGFLQGAEGNTYVPFTLTFEPDTVTASTLAAYIFVTEHVDQSPVTPETPDNTETEDNAAEAELPDAIFEEGYFPNVNPTPAEPLHLSLAFAAPGGTYDIYLALRDSSGGAAAEDSQATAKVMMLHEELTIPDLWDEFQTSTVIVTDVVEPLTAPMTPDQRMLYPYSIGGVRIEPKHDLIFGKQEELSLVFLVYNPGVQDASKPDVTIEYTFHQRTADGEEFFNDTNPQQFNGQTLPPGFDVTMGHPIIAGQVVPLTLFPAGDFRLEIAIVDNTSGSVETRDVNFTVEET